MAFDSFGEFIAMEGHGPYVWTCYAVFFLAMAVVVFWSLWERRHIIDRQRRRLSGTGVQDNRPASASFTRIESSKD